MKVREYKRAIRDSDNFQNHCTHFFCVLTLKPKKIIVYRWNQLYPKTKLLLFFSPS